MKKLLALCALIALLLPVVALADVLTSEWQEATLEELLQAQQEISNRISELRAAAASDVERVELSGSGTSILSDVVIPFAPSRVIVECEGETSVKFTGGAYDYTFDAKTHEESFFDQTGTFGLLVESPSAWSIVVEPITAGGVLPLSGSGPFVSDFFELPAPMIVSITVNASDMDALLSNLIVKLHHQYENIDSWKGDSLTNELLSSGNESFAADVILQPVNGRDQYCISVTCEPGVVWSVSPKE